MTLGERAGLRDPITLHNFYVPAGGDIPDPAVNPKFAHKLSFLDEMRATAATSAATARRAILVGDLNVAPLEHDVWSHKQMLRVVSHTPIECEKLTAAQKPAIGSTSMRVLVPEPAEALHLVELSRRRDWEAADKRPAARPYLDRPALADRVVEHQDRQERSRLQAAVRPCAGDGDDGDVSADSHACSRSTATADRDACGITEVPVFAGRHLELLARVGRAVRVIAADG